jgi:hypothetical protein
LRSNNENRPRDKHNTFTMCCALFFLIAVSSVTSYNHSAASFKNSPNSSSSSEGSGISSTQEPLLFAIMEVKDSSQPCNTWDMERQISGTCSLLNVGNCILAPVIFTAGTILVATHPIKVMGVFTGMTNHEHHRVKHKVCPEQRYRFSIFFSPSPLLRNVFTMNKNVRI